MKRNLEKTRLFLQALAAMSIDFDKILQTMDTIRASLKGMGGDENEIATFLRLFNDELGTLKRESKKIDLIRHKGEAIVWHGQKASPHLKSPLEDMELSDGAIECIPIGVQTIGELCQYRPSELGSSSRYTNEIKDILRAYVLVLKPDKE